MTPKGEIPNCLTQLHYSIHIVIFAQADVHSQIFETLPFPL